MEGLKVLHVCHKPPYPAVDGGTTAMLSLAQALNAAGAKVTLACFSTHRHSVCKPHPAFVEQHCLPIDTKVKLIHVIQGTLGLNQTSIHLKRFKDHSGALLEKVQLADFDLIILDSLYSAGEIAWIKEQTNAKVIVRTHNVEAALVMSRHYLAPWPQKPFLKREYELLSKEEIHLLNHADGILSIAQNDLEHLKSKNVTPPAKVIFPSYTVPDNYTVPRNELQIGFIGALDWPPNLEGLRWFIGEVWPLITTKLPNATFHVAGKASDEYLKLFNLLQPGIVPHGFVPNPTKFIQDQNVMVAPILEGSGIRIKLIETMVAGRPSVSTTAGIEGLQGIEGIAEVADSPQSFANAVVDPLTQPDVATLKGNQALEVARKHFDHEAIGESIVSFYHEIKQRN